MTVENRVGEVRIQELEKTNVNGYLQKSLYQEKKIGKRRENLILTCPCKSHFYTYYGKKVSQLP